MAFSNMFIGYSHSHQGLCPVFVRLLVNTPMYGQEQLASVH